MSLKIYDEENLDLQDDEMNDEIYINHNDEEDNYDEPIDDEESPKQREFISTSDYKVSAITEAFLRTELIIKCENNRTVLKFAYRDNVYKGIVLHKMSKYDYIFLVQDASVRNGEKTMKKIHIPDASLISC